jgi:MFS family permease
MMKRAFSSLAHRNYKLWFQGQMVSLAGTWMQNTAQAYLAFELTKSPAFLGYVAFANGAPTWIFMLYGGTLVDRYSRRTILIWTQLVMMILAIIMALLTWFQVIEPWHILLLTALLGAANSFDAPARQSFVSELVPKQDMTNAVALNGAMFNTASTVGPALAGIAYALYGPVMCFTTNAVSFLAVIIALLRMKLTPIPPKPHHVSVRSQMLEVWR